MLKDRFLLGIFIGISVLVIAALILFFVRQGQVSYVDDSTPEGVLRNYILAIQKHDYERAYGYLADQPGTPDANQFRQEFLAGYQNESISRTAVEVNQTQIDELNQTAIIQVTVLSANQELFGSGYQTRDTAALVRQNGAWKISRAPYPYSIPEAPYAAPTRQLFPTLTPTAPTR